MTTDEIIRKVYNIPADDNLYVSTRFYKQYSESSFCAYFVHCAECRIVEFTCKPMGIYNPVFVREIWQGKNNGKGEFAPIIRQWTGRNIVWNFEKE